MSINAYRQTATLTEDGVLQLKDIPCPAGTAVEVIILVPPSGSVTSDSTVNSPNAAVFDDPDANADYMTTVAATLSEWNSEADHSAYRHL